MINMSFDTLSSRYINVHESVDTNSRSGFIRCVNTAQPLLCKVNIRAGQDAAALRGRILFNNKQTTYFEGKKLNKTLVYRSCVNVDEADTLTLSDSAFPLSLAWLVSHVKLRLT